MLLNKTQIKIIDTFNHLHATNLNPATGKQVQEITGIEENTLMIEIDFLRSKGFIREMGMGNSIDNRMFYAI